MPFKKTDEGFEYGEEGDHVLNNRSRFNPFNVLRVIRDTLNRPLRWNDEINDFEIDIDKWMDEVNNE